VQSFFIVLKYNSTMRNDMAPAQILFAQTGHGEDLGCLLSGIEPGERHCDEPDPDIAPASGCGSLPAQFGLRLGWFDYTLPVLLLSGQNGVYLFCTRATP
jgi:hypothetical protein